MSAETEVKTSGGAAVSASHGATAGTGSATRARGGGSGTAILAIMQRELASLFFSPIAYVVAFVFLVFTGLSFVNETLVAGTEANLRPLFDRMAALLVFALPVLTMRSVADEFATGAIESLMTAPVTDGAVVLGKFLGTMVFYLVLLATTFLHLILLSAYADPVGGMVFAGYFGLVLLGAMFIAIGLFASCFSKYQLLAALLGVAILSVFSFAASYGAEYAPTTWQRELCVNLNIFYYFSEFSRGAIDSRGVVFFVSGTILFLTLATKVLESRRWR